MHADPGRADVHGPPPNGSFPFQSNPAFMRANKGFVTSGRLGLAVLFAITLSIVPRPGLSNEGRAEQGPTVRSAAESERAKAFALREEAYRANNLGVALLEQFKHKEGADEFRRALKIEPRLKVARINLAIALFNVPDLPAAAEAARAALEVAPDAPQPHYLLGLIAKQQNRPEEAVESLMRVLSVDRNDVGTNVQLGQLYSQQRDYGKAVERFRTAVEVEPYNGTALYNLATALLRSGEREEGQRYLQRFQELRGLGSATTVGQNYLEQGRYAEAVTSTGAEPELVERKSPDVFFVDSSAAVLPTWSVAPPPAAKTSRLRNQRPPVRAAGRAATVRQQSDSLTSHVAEEFGGGVTLFDFDGDGDLDVLDLAPYQMRLLRNDGGRFLNVTGGSGALAARADGVNLGAVAGDYDNDGRADLFVLRYGRSSLYRNEGAGRFSERTDEAKIPAYPFLSVSAAFVDVDHDGDLDLFVAGLADLRDPKSESRQIHQGHSAAQRSGRGTQELLKGRPAAPNLLLRNNGEGIFAEITGGAKVLGEKDRTLAVVPTDYDNRRDVDLLTVNFDFAPRLYRNLRDASFTEVGRRVGLDAESGFASVAAGDLNKDSFTDFYFGRDHTNGTFAMSDGRGGFSLAPGPSAKDDPGHLAAQLLDYDNDGLLDLVTLSAAEAGQLRIWRNVGDGWVREERATSRRSGQTGAISNLRLSPRALASADADGDGDVDLFVRAATGELKFLRNEGGSRNASVRVNLAGKVSNRSGVGSKIEARAGSLQQKFETYSATPAPAPADVLFGLGPRKFADAVRVIWPSGVVQAEVESVSKEGAQTVARVEPGTLSVTELDRKPSSCPYLYTWNGERFEFVTDFMGGGELGYWVAPGVRAVPDPDEYVRIRGDQLRPRDGRYEIRVTNELEEAIFFDRLQLVAVSHQEGVEVYPNEGLGNPTSANFLIYATKDARLPRSARDEAGRDVLPRIARLDRKYVDTFATHRIRGYAKEHALILDLGSEGDGKKAVAAKSTRPTAALSSTDTPTRTLLLMTGWTDYAFSSDNVAAHQAGLSLKPPSLQVKDAEGNWRTVIENVGIPVGRPQTVAVDLTGKFLSDSREIRLVTNMRIYWDQILVDVSGGKFPTKVERLEPDVADLRWRGFSAAITPDGREPLLFDFTRVSFVSPWKTLPGRYTREGDVRELLGEVDDVFVVSRTGDEIALSFDATLLEPLPQGWTRTFLLYADGFSKEMDINSASPDQLSPLPFHGMKSYPYAAPETYPMTPAREAYLNRYNTRVVYGPVPPLVAGNR